MRARRADQERHAGEVADRRARRAGRRARCLGASRSARHGRVIICHGNIRKREEVRAGELLREIAERKERHAGKVLVLRSSFTSPPSLGEGDTLIVTPSLPERLVVYTHCVY